MLRILAVSASLVATLGPAWAEEDCTQAPNQMEANICAGRVFKKADAELNRVYAVLRPKLDANGQHNLVVAERAWITFRDLECNLRTGYNTIDLSANGTIAPLIYGECKTTLTRQRIKDLEAQIKCPGGDLSCPP